MNNFVGCKKGFANEHSWIEGSNNLEDLFEEPYRESADGYLKKSVKLPPTYTSGMAGTIMCTITDPKMADDEALQRTVM